MPPEVLTGCAALATLSLHGNPVTAEELREMPGWRQFDERRRSKYDKQVGHVWGGVRAWGMEIQHTLLCSGCWRGGGSLPPPLLVPACQAAHCPAGWLCAAGAGGHEGAERRV